VGQEKQTPLYTSPYCILAFPYCSLLRIFITHYRLLNFVHSYVLGSLSPPKMCITSSSIRLCFGIYKTWATLLSIFAHLSWPRRPLFVQCGSIDASVSTRVTFMGLYRSQRIFPPSLVPGLSYFLKKSSWVKVERLLVVRPCQRLLHWSCYNPLERPARSPRTSLSSSSRTAS
jgi:hypothetical protein